MTTLARGRGPTGSRSCDARRARERADRSRRRRTRRSRPQHRGRVPARARSGRNDRGVPDRGLCAPPRGSARVAHTPCIAGPKNRERSPFRCGRPPAERVIRLGAMHPNARAARGLAQAGDRLVCGRERLGGGLTAQSWSSRNDVLPGPSVLQARLRPLQQQPSDRGRWAAGRAVPPHLDLPAAHRALQLAMRPLRHLEEPRQGGRFPDEGAVGGGSLRDP